MRLASPPNCPLPQTGRSMVDRDDASFSTTHPDYDRDTRYAYRNLGWPWLLALLLVPLILAALLAGLRGDKIETNLHDRSLVALQGAGMSGVKVDFDGRDATLKAGAGAAGRRLTAADLGKAKGIVEGVDGVRVVDIDTAGLRAGGKPRGRHTGAGSPSESPSKPARDCTPATLQKKIDKVVGKDDITFAVGKSAPDAASMKEIAAVAKLLVPCTDVAVQVKGHTDGFSSQKVQQQKSQARADAVVKLLQDGGVTGSITGTGVGSSEPVGDPLRKADRARNRFADITVH